MLRNKLVESEEIIERIGTEKRLFQSQLQVSQVKLN